MWRLAVISHSRALLLLSARREFSASNATKTKRKLAPLQERRMVDRFRVWAKGGEGGNGCWSYRRSRTDRHGKPDGGNGGRGGDVLLECSSTVWDFSNLQHHLNGKRGGHGASKGMIGTRGSDKVMKVPVGTVIHLVSGEAPSVVECTSTKSLDPWEIPGDIEADVSIPARPSYNQAISDNKSSGLSCFKEDVSNLLVVANGPSQPLSAAKFKNKADMVDSFQNYHDGHREIEDNENHDVEEIDDDLTEEEDNSENEVKQHSVAELTKPGQRILIARGGDGGLGNASLRKENNKFHKTNKSNHEAIAQDLHDVNVQPSLTLGIPGTESVLILELKSIADVGLVGMPNAGKSTLLGAISRAKPAVGHYAFTTLRPNIGNLNYEDYSMTVADIPGLIKGAHANRGLGHAFLRHIERTKVLVYVVDLAAALGDRKGIPPWEQLRDLVLELEYHQEGLSRKPSLVVANKIDEDGADMVYEELKRRVLDVPILPVSAVLGEGIPELKVGLRRLMDGSELHELQLERIMAD